MDQKELQLKYGFNMQKLKAAGYDAAFYDLESGIADYVKHYLQKGC